MGNKFGICVLLLVNRPALALNNGLGLTPPLGYNAYDHVGCCANETTMMQQGQALIDTGLHKLGYKYVNMDCGWIGGRRTNGTLFESPTKFPRGLRFLANWMHERGLLLGVYSDRGTHDFSGAGLGMKGHEYQDAAWMASVGVDYLKVDDMSGTPRTQAGAYADYARIRDALNATGRPIFYSTCGHSGGTEGHPDTPAWMGGKCDELANACRIAADVRFWGPGTFGTDKAVDVMASYEGKFSKAGAWPDPDLIYSYGPVGPKGTRATCAGSGKLEYCTGSFCDPVRSHSVTQFGLWAVMGAPLLLSFDLTNLQQSDIDFVYGNPEIIAVSQDADVHGHGSPGGRRVFGQDFVKRDTRGGECNAKSFPLNRTGVQAIGLRCHNATSAAACVSACCDYTDCTTWQYNPDYGPDPLHCVHHGTSVKGPCWIGTPSRVDADRPGWIGGSKPDSHGQNIWARNLHDGSTALIFINTNTDTASVTCDIDCLVKADLKTGITYRVRNILERKDEGEIALTSAGLSMQVKGDVGSVMVRLTPL